MKIAIVIPCFNVERVCEAVIRDAIPFARYIVLVNDGSTDGTGKILNLIHSEYPEHIHVIQFANNRGKGFALIEAFRYILKNLDFDMIATMDGDGQHRPSDIPVMAELIEQGADLVIGQRTFSQMPIYSRLANFFIALILRLRYFKSPWDNQSGLRAFNPNFAREVAARIEGGRYEMEFCCILLALKEKKNIKLLPISTIYFNKNSESHYKKVSDSLRILKIFFMHLIHSGKI